VQQADARDVDLFGEERSQNVLVDEIQVNQRGTDALPGAPMFGQRDLHLDLIDHLRRQQHLPDGLLIRHGTQKHLTATKKPHRRGGVSL
jgi:hypothetical protein